MIDTRFSPKEEKIFESLIGARLHAIKSTQKDTWGRIYGNAVLITSAGEYEIRNELESVPYFEGVEDISVLHIAEIGGNNAYHPMILGVPVICCTIEEEISGVTVIEDEISVFTPDKLLIYKAVFDTAIVFHAGSHDYVFSREWYFGEDILYTVCETGGFDKNVYPVEKIVQDWTDEDGGTIVKCCRREVDKRDVSSRKSVNRT